MLSRYYGFTIEEIKKMTMYQYKSYLQNIHVYESIANGKEIEIEESMDILQTASEYGINIPE